MAVAAVDLARNARLLDGERRRENRSLLGLALPAVLIVTILMVVPLAWLLSLSFIGLNGEPSLENYTRLVTEGAYLQMFVTTFQVSFLVTLLCILLGYPTAYLLTILPPRWSGLLMLLVLVPFWTSGLVRTFSWIILLQRNGVVNSALVGMGVIERPLQLVYNMTGTIIGLVHIMVPFMVLPLYASMKTIDLNLMRAAANLGSSPSHAFQRVFLPLSMPGLIAGTIMIFVMVLGFYFTPALLGGGRVKMIAQRIEESVSLYPSWGPASALAVVLLVLTALCLIAGLLLARYIARER